MHPECAIRRGPIALGHRYETFRCSTNVVGAHNVGSKHVDSIHTRALASTWRSAPTEGTHVVYFSRYYTNYAEFVTRFMYFATMLTENVTFSVPYLAPSDRRDFHVSLLAPWGDVHPHDSVRGTFRKLAQCCINRRPALSKAQRLAFQSRLVRYYHVPAPAFETTSPPSIRFVKRADSRNIANVDALVDECRQVFVRCAIIGFHNLTLMQSLSLMRQTRVLVGMHGSDLANAFFMDTGAVVEIFGTTFGSRGTYGMQHFAGLNHSGIYHRRMVDADDGSCGARLRKTHCNRGSGCLSGSGVYEKAINCPVSVGWGSLQPILQSCVHAL
tara:strand:+ start:4155 stop:5138 length:984 start_codon:yes stop_codon:yes gene_type:complete